MTTSNSLQFQSLEHIIDTVLLSGGNLVARVRKNGQISMALKLQRLANFKGLMNILELHLKKYGLNVTTSLVKKDKSSIVLYVQVDDKLKNFYKDWYKIKGYSKSGVVVLNTKVIPKRNLIIDENTLAVWYAASGSPYIMKWETKSTNKSKVCGGCLYFPGGQLACAKQLITYLKGLNIIGSPKLDHKNGRYGEYYYLKMDLPNFKKLIKIVKPKLSKSLAFKLDIEQLGSESGALGS